jgi:hypothetical protein
LFRIAAPPIVADFLADAPAVSALPIAALPLSL